MKHYKDINNNIYGYDEDQVPLDGLIEITESERDFILLLKKEELESTFPFTERRKAEYPPITDYIDGVVKGDQDQINAYIAACLAVKAKYPKPTE